MTCDGFIRGRVGETVSFHVEAEGLLGLSGRVTVGDRTTGDTVERRTLDQDALEQGWELEPNHAYTVHLLRIPKNTDLDIDVKLDGRTAVSYDCAGGSERTGPWVVWGKEGGA